MEVVLGGLTDILNRWVTCHVSCSAVVIPRTQYLINHMTTNGFVSTLLCFVILIFGRVTIYKFVAFIVFLLHYYSEESTLHNNLWRHTYDDVFLLYRTSAGRRCVCSRSVIGEPPHPRAVVGRNIINRRTSIGCGGLVWVLASNK